MRKFLTLLAMLVMSVTMMMAQKTVTGSVISAEDGEPIIGASVIVTGTTTGTVTDIDGNFSLKVSESAKTLTVSFVGMETQEVAIKGGKLKVILSANDEVLDEVMVVAFGTQKKSSFTGSAVQIKADAIESHVASSATGALAGTTPGVQVMSPNGDPASNDQKIRIRGVASMAASNNPLIVVDGMPYSASLSSINPTDIESMTVLKDASATAVYGARGANGVILITTKRGAAGDAKIKFDAKFGSNSRLIPRYDVVTDPGEYYEAVYAKLYNSQRYIGKTEGEAYAFAQANLLNHNNGGVGYQVFTVPTGETLIGTNGKLNPNATLGYSDGTYYYRPDDWYDEAFHNSFRQEYNVSASGGTDKMSYFAGLSMLDDGGIVSNSGYKRYTARTNVEYQVKKWIRLQTNMSYTHSRSDQPSYSASSWGSSGNLFYIANEMGPIYPLYVRDAQGNIMYQDGRKVYDSNQTNFKRPSVVGNAVRDNELNSQRTYGDIFTGKFGLVLTPLKGLTLSANVGVSVDNQRYNALDSEFGSASAYDGIATVESDRYFDTNAQLIANYKTTFADVHNFEVTAGYERYNYKAQTVYAYNNYLFDPFIGELGNANGKEMKYVTSYTNNYMLEGLLVRAQYDFMEKYFLSASYRRDASSRFAKGHRWGNFASVSAAWLLSNEDFIKEYEWINELKAKVSFGTLGNDNLLDSKGYASYYPYADLYDTSYNEETGTYSTILKQKGNEDLTWETSKTFNAGVDFNLFNGRLSGSVEYFDRRTSDLLYYKKTPTSAGISTGEYPVNVGETQNNGVEFDINGVIYKNRDIEWSLSLNLSHIHNEILSLDPSVAETGIKESTRIYRVGGSIYNAYMYKYAGVDKENGMALFYKEDGTTTNQISAADRFDCGSTLPKLFGGFGTQVRAYGFDLSAQFQFQLGGKFYDGEYQALMWTQDNVGSALHKDWRKAWTPEHPTNNPRWAGDAIISQSTVDYFQISSNYLSVNNVTLGYTFPAKWMRKANIDGLRVYVAGENLAVGTKRKGVDPRYSEGIGGYSSGGSAMSNNAYSAMRTITAGLSVTF